MSLVSRLTHILRHNDKGIVIALFGFLCAVWLVLSVISCGRAKLHPESANYMMHYTGPKTFLQKVFDPKYTDEDCYQSREFSYVADWIDYNLTYKSAQVVGAHFQSPLYYVLALGTAGVMFYASGYSLLGLLCAGIFLFSPNIFFPLWIFRTAKILTAFFTAVLAVLFLKSIRHELSSAPMFAAGFCVTFLMSVSDMQGYALAMLFFAVICVAAVILKDKKIIPLAAAIALALVIRVVYDRFIASLLVEYFNGYQLSRSYQDIDILHSLSSPLNWADGLQLWVQTFAYFTGGIPIYAAFVLATIVPCWFVWKLKTAEDMAQKRLAIMGVLFCGLWLMFIPINVVMVARHPPLISITMFYYWVPLTSVLYIVLQFGCENVFTARGKTVVAILLAGLFAMNAAETASIRTINSEYAIASNRVFDCIKNNGYTPDRLPDICADVCRRYTTTPKSK